MSKIVTIKNIKIKTLLNLLLELNLKYESMDLLLDQENNRIIIETIEIDVNIDKPKDEPPETDIISNIDDIV